MKNVLLCEIFLKLRVFEVAKFILNRIKEFVLQNLTSLTVSSVFKAFDPFVILRRGRFNWILNNAIVAKINLYQLRLFA